MKKADKALYPGKKNGRFRYEVYQEEASHNPQPNWSHSLSGNSDGGHGCILSRCLELLDQADSMSKALQLVLAEAADYWKVERVWLAELSPAHSPVRLCSRSSSPRRGRPFWQTAGGVMGIVLILRVSFPVQRRLITKEEHGMPSVGFALKPRRHYSITFRMGIWK